MHRIPGLSEIFIYGNDDYLFWKPTPPTYFVSDDRLHLRGYFQREFDKQSELNKLMVLWASGRVGGLITSEQKSALVDQTFAMQMADGGWAMGNDFSLADCAAMPSLYYGDRLEPCSEFRNVSAYLDRLKARASFARVLDEAEPYFDLFPKDAE